MPRLTTEAPNYPINCKLCEHFEKDCIWNHDYLDTDYAYDCIDFERNVIYAFLDGLTEYIKHSSQEVITAKMSREFLSELVVQLNDLLSRKETNAETNNSSTK